MLSYCGYVFHVEFVLEIISRICSSMWELIQEYLKKSIPMQHDNHTKCNNYCDDDSKNNNNSVKAFVYNMKINGFAGLLIHISSQYPYRYSN